MAVAVTVGIERVGAERGLVHIRDAVVVVVGVRVVADAVAVVVGPLGTVIGEDVLAVVHTVAVPVVVADIAQTVVIQVFLVLIGDVWTVVYAIRHAVVVTVLVKYRIKLVEVWN